MQDPPDARTEPEDIGWQAAALSVEIEKCATSKSLVCSSKSVIDRFLEVDCWNEQHGLDEVYRDLGFPLFIALSCSRSGQR